MNKEEKRANLNSIFKSIIDLDKSINSDEVKRALDQEELRIDPEMNQQDTIPEYEDPENPIPPSGAVVYEGSATANGGIENNMSQSPDQTPAVMIDLGTGLPIVPEQINEEYAKQFDPSNPARAFLQGQQPPVTTPQEVQPQFFPQPVPPQMMPTQVPPAMQPVPLHRVDEQPKQKKEPPKADNVDVDLDKVTVADSFIKEKAPKVVPGIVDQKLPKAEPEEVKPIVNLFDNTEIIEKFPNIPLKEIEIIANNNGHNVTFEEFPHMGLISVYTTTPNGKNVIPEKCFTIDSGMIIDHRAKVMAGCPRINHNVILEQCPIYELFVIDQRTRKKMLDEKLINDIFFAGVLNIQKREMYSPEYKALNMKIALITLPTKNLNKEQRNSLQSYIVKMDKDGYFDKAIAMSPYSRFAFVDKVLDKEHLSNFTMINEGIPAFYGAGVLPVIPIIIESADGKIQIKSNGENPPVTQPLPNYPIGGQLPNGIKCNCGHC